MLDTIDGLSYTQHYKEIQELKDEYEELIDRLLEERNAWREMAIEAIRNGGTLNV